MKRLGLFLFPLHMMLVHAGLPPALKCPQRQKILFSYLMSCHPMNYEKKSIFDLDEMQCFVFLFENAQICRHFSPPFAPVFSWFGISCDVDSGKRDSRLDSSRSFYLCKFNLHVVAHTKCPKGAFCMDYEAKFTEVKRARWVKPHFPESTSQL